MNAGAMKRAMGCLAVLAWTCSLPVAADSLIEGRVRLPSGDAVPGARVMLFDLSEVRRLASVTTDETGRFSLRAELGTSALPERFALGHNYPNPFNPSTIIPYELPVSAPVRLEVFNLLGQRIATLVDGHQPAGFHSARWDATDAQGRAVGAGVYLYRLQSGSMVATERMVLIDGQAGVPTPGRGDPADLPASGTGPSAAGTAAYGLTVSGPGLATYVDPAFEVHAGMGPLELEVSETSAVPRAKAASTSLLGDVDNNGRVDIVDALLVATYIADNSTTMPNNGDISRADMNSDGRIDYFDVWLIVTQYLLQQLGGQVPVESDSRIYWLDRGTDRIQRSNLDGSGLEDLVTAGLSDPTDLALDAAGGKMYWTDDGTNKIQRSNLDGSQVEDLVTAGLAGPAGLELDIAAGTMYWTDHGTGKIQRSNLDGSGVEDLVTGLGDPRGLALHIAAGTMYWTDQGSRKIQRANLDGSEVQDLVTSGLRGPAALVLDTDSNKMYWTDWGTDKIQRSNLDGSQVEDLVTTGLNLAEGLALDAAAGKMYWTDSGTARIQRADLDGSNVQDLITGLRAPSGLELRLATDGRPAPPVATLSPDPSAVDLLDDGTWHAFTVRASEAVLVVVNPAGTAPRLESAGTSGAGDECPAESRDSLTREDGQSLYLAGCSGGTAKVELRRASDQTLLRTYAFTIEELPPATTGPTAAKIYWTNGDKIQRAGADGSNVEDLITSGSPRALAVDVLAGHIYWTDQDTRWIWRAKLDGSEAEAVVTSGLIRPVAIALDLTRGQMYWTDAGSNRIQRANLDGSRVQTLVRTGLHSPEGLALDVDGGKVYWSDFGTNKIQRANLDGSQVEDLVTTGLRIPGELALDVGAGKLYWTDYGTDKIQRANLDGSNVEDLVTSGLRIAKGLAVDATAGKIYWADSGTGKIQRANLDGSGVEDLVSPTQAPAGLALANPAASLSPNPLAVSLSRRGTWRRFEVQASEPVLVVANPTGTEARILVAQGEATSECPATAEASVTRYHGQPVYLAACEAGQATVELRRVSDQTVLRTYAVRVPDKARIYWTNEGSRDRIQRADIDGSNVQDLVATGLRNPIDIALDLTDAKMYWPDHGTDKIQRADLDGSNVEDLITTGLRYPVGLALDLTARRMYWTDMEADRIMRADLDGSNVEALVTSGLVTPRGLALDVAGGKMYWTDQGTGRIKIHRANLDGSNVEGLVATTVIPDRLALDLQGNRIYWTGGGKIQRASLDGSGIQDLITGLEGPRGIALDLEGGRIYWTDSGTRKIQSANLDGSDIRDVVTGLNIPTSMTLE